MTIDGGKLLVVRIFSPLSFSFYGKGFSVAFLFVGLRRKVRETSFACRQLSLRIFLLFDAVERKS